MDFLFPNLLGKQHHAPHPMTEEFKHEHIIHTPSCGLSAAMILFSSACLQNTIHCKYSEEISYSDTDMKSEQDLLCILCLEEKKPTAKQTKPRLRLRNFTERELQEFDLSEPERSDGFQLFCCLGSF